jgi:hypothetical protein
MGRLAQRAAIVMLCGLCFLAVEAEAQTRLGFDSSISVPRFGEGDLDGDGRMELVVGGRVGGFRALTDPMGTGQARVEICRIGETGMALLARSANLEALNDLAVGDLDGDGAAEIVAVGDFYLHVLAYAQGRLTLRYSEALASGRFMRVECADLDGDGTAEIAIAESRPQPGAEVRPTDIHFYRFKDTLERLGGISIEGHVGDMCLGDLDGDGRVELVLEQGAEEIGGLISGYRIYGQETRLLFTRQVTQEYQRILNMAARFAAGGALVALGDIRGEVELMRFVEDDLVPLERLITVGSDDLLRGLHLTRLFDQSVLQIISGTSEPGETIGGFWRFDRR